MAEVERSHPPALGPAPEPRLPAIRRDRLENGMGLVVLPLPHVPLVVLEVVVGAGSDRDGVGRSGLADMTVHLLPEGAAGRGVLEIADRLASIGASLTTGATYDAARVRITVLRSRVADALAILADLLLHAEFPPEELERMRAEREIDLLRSTDDPAVVARRAFAYELFGRSHPYAAPEEGTIPSVHALARESFVDFYRKAYVPSNATLIAVGDLVPDELRIAAERAFEGWADGAVRRVDVSPPDRPGRGIELVDRPSSAQSEIRIGHVGVAYTDPDAAALQILNHLLGGAFHSRINLNLRERRGWTYGARSGWDLRRGPGSFVVSTSVSNDVTRGAVEEILGELRRAAAGPIEEEERALAVNGLTLSLPLKFQTPGQIADRAREMVVYDLPDTWWDEIAERYRAVTVEDLGRVAREHVRPAEALTIVVGDASAIAQDLETLGPVALRAWKSAQPDREFD